ncbi:MAG TPA: aminotransferase class III-fold pyridoxal phosphate-dependent enzyme, partial [Pseudomonadales bacterium]|nr:aminotransferase class III-fold pyridoxal phosphate-dependent enzyme [Pseudomonadales bacterium]
TGCDSVRDIRGEGLLLGIELSEPCAEFPSLCAAQGLIVNVTADRVIRLLPPLIMTPDEADQLIERLVRLIRTHAADERTKPRN